jgi:hypothetical protein
MPNYDVRYLDHYGVLTHAFCATCDDETRARIVAHAMKPSSCQQLEMWIGGSLIYQRAPSATTRGLSYLGIQEAPKGER